MCGNQLIKALHDEFGDSLRVTLSATSASSIRSVRGRVEVTINADSLRQVNSLVSDVKRQKNKEIDSLVYAFLSDQFPARFTGGAPGTFKYRPNKIAELLEDPEVRDHLSDNDKTAIKNAYPELLAEMEFTLRATSKVKFISDGIKKSKRVYLEKTIAEFEEKLTKASTEPVWQRFLHEHILMLLNTYAYVIEKQNVELAGKFPDFMLVDAYGYLDVYEIKRPQTSLLKYDRSRKNYFWDTELAKAIIQTEKYMSSVERNRFEMEAKFRQQEMEVRIVRPRGFIIAGLRSDLTKDARQEDLRILNDSLKNIDVICYDDLLDNLHTLLGRLTTETDGK